MENLQIILLRKLLMEQKEIKSVLRRNQQINANFLSRITQMVVITLFVGIGVYAANNLSPEARSKQAENWIEKVILVAATGITAKVFTSNNSEKKEVEKENEEAGNLQEDRLELLIDQIVEDEINSYSSRNRDNRLVEKNLPMERQEG